MTVDENRIVAAEAAYAAGDFVTAAAEYLASVGDGEVEGSGPALHLAGNSLMRCRRLEEAVEAYRRATKDSGYERIAAVRVNLGSALSALGRNEEAIEAFDAALEDPSYPTPFKPLQGRAAALYALGRFEDAASSYRKAAWESGNPDPGKSLNNLGLCFMALGRPQDAVEAFKAALGSESYAAKGKAAVNLALAYAAMGFFDEAVVSFESARDTYGHVLAGETLAAYEEARTAAADEAALAPVVQSVAEPVPVEESVPAAEEAVEAEPAPAPAPTEEIANETDAGEETVKAQPEIETDELADADAEAPVAEGVAVGPRVGQAPALPDADDEQTARFFRMTEDEMRDADRAARKEKRRGERTPRSIALRVALVLIAVLVLAGGVFGVLYLGYGYPTQEQTVSGLIDAYRAGSTYGDFWVAVPATDVKQQMRALPAKFSNYKIAGIDRGPTRSTAVVTVALESGTVLSYTITLAREGVGWKVIGIENRWTSTN